jgi:methionine-rich copper-binding protein CopC
MRATTMKRTLMRKSLLSFAGLALATVTAMACGELTGPESPTTPSNVVATIASPTSVNLSWTPSPLNDGVVSYSIYRNGTKVGETVGTESTYTDTGLSPQTTYVYSVAANCVGGVVSDRSVETEASTVTTVDITPPTVVQGLITPPPGSTQVSPEANINVVFSEPMDPATINATTLTLRVTNGAAITGAVTYNAETRRATLTPAGALPNFSSLTATISTGAKDLAGNALAQPFSWTFTTRDDVPPTVTATSPANGATGVSPTAVITMTFSEAMDATTINASNITLRATSSGTVLTSTVTYNTSTRVATLTPSAPLTQGVNYTVSIGAGVKDAQGIAIVPTSFSFTAGDITSPTVVSTVPADGATGVATGAVISATFSEAMDPTTINTTTFTLRLTSGGGNLAGTVSYNGSTNTATFTPAAPLAGGTSYTATITTGVRDVANNPMTAAKVWAFTTVDVVPPTVTSVNPANAQLNVPTNTTVQVTFSEPMDPATITTSTVVLRNTATTAVVPATVSYNTATRVATLTPTGPLSNATNYTVNVTTGVKDVSGNALAAQFNSTFTTAAAPDNIAPTIVSRTPANGATSIPIDANVTVTFSEPMDPATINTTTITLTPTAGGSAVAATVTYTGNTATLNPTADLLNNTSYTITVTTGVKDVAGNQLAAQSTSTFTTIPDTTAPTVTSTSPLNGAINVAKGANITITFSEAMDPTTINGTTIAVSGGDPVAPVVGQVTYDVATRTATFNPSSDLAPSKPYTVTVTGGALGVKDAAGNPMAVNAVFSFTTGT